MTRRANRDAPNAPSGIAEHDDERAREPDRAEQHGAEAAHARASAGGAADADPRPV